MTNNYFLHTKSLEVRSFEDYKTGMSKLIEIKYKCASDEYIYIDMIMYIVKPITHLYVGPKTAKPLQQ